MKLLCLEAYRTDFGTYSEGEEFEVEDEHGALLMRDAPSAFREVVEKAAKPVAAVSEEMASGQSAPDRRARGGRRRST